jgi:hypothetical protein
MEYATLGNTGLLVSKLCFGTMTFGEGKGLFKGISGVGQAGADELVKTAIDGGLLSGELRQLDEVSALAPEYPGWVLPFQAADRLGPADRWECLRADHIGA